MPKRWTPVQVRKLFEDLEDVNYHSFLARLIELIEQRLPDLAAKLDGWCQRSTASPANVTYVPTDDVRKALRHLEASCVGKAKTALRKLCPDIPELPPFEIV